MSVTGNSLHLSSIMNITSAVFDVSAPDLESCPEETVPEFAFIGRSNVGKSSLLNALAGKKGLAKVSKTPGFTKMINFFTMNKAWRLVDLPGYGFAQVARENKAKFNSAVNDYLTNRSNLACVFVLIDSRHSPQEIDLEFIDWLASHSVPFVLVFTKVDKLKPVQVQKNIEAFKESIAGWFEKPPEIFTSSSVTKSGLPELLGVIDESLQPVD
jgi:GTP-binding protein